VRREELARKLEGGGRFVLGGVKFAGRTAVLVRAEGLEDLARVLADQPGTNVRIEVFVDATDDPGADTRISMAQAMAVLRRLRALGVARERVAHEARGGEAPLLPNFTGRGRAANRRVEVAAVKAR
jgi:outer membrane protein OmpA-like peptidoglycan-associated protein